MQARDFLRSIFWDGMLFLVWFCALENISGKKLFWSNLFLIQELRFWTEQGLFYWRVFLLTIALSSVYPPVSMVRFCDDTTLHCAR